MGKSSNAPSLCTKINENDIYELEEKENSTVLATNMIDTIAKTNLSNNGTRGKRNNLKWIIEYVTEAIEQTIKCDNVTLKIQKSQLSQLINKSINSSIKQIITGNWGCGTSKCGDPQIKLVIQWLAASVAGAPVLIYHTYRNTQLYKLDTLFRVLIDRKWTVGQLTSAMLRFSQQILNEPHVIHENNTLFDELIGIEKFND